MLNLLVCSESENTTEDTKTCLKLCTVTKLSSCKFVKNRPDCSVDKTQAANYANAGGICTADNNKAPLRWWETKRACLNSG